MKQFFILIFVMEDEVNEHIKDLLGMIWTAHNRENSEKHKGI